MVMDQNSLENRQKAFEIIKKIRESPVTETFECPPNTHKVAFKKVRPFHPPEVNTNAETIVDFLTTQVELFEPPLTIGIPLDQLKAQADHGNVLKFPKVPCQSVERTIKLVSLVSSKVRSYRRRHQEILCKLYHRKLKAQG